MHLVDALREYLGWCPDHRMAQVRKHTPWNETEFDPLPTEGTYVNDGVIVDYGRTGISIPVFIGVVIGVIGALVISTLFLPFATFRVVSGILMCGLLLPVVIVILYRDLKRTRLEINQDALMIRRALYQPVVISKDEIATMEIRNTKPPVPVWLQAGLSLFLIPVSSAYILSREYLQFVSGEISSSLFFAYLGFYLSIVLLFLVSYYRSSIRSHFTRHLFIKTGTGNVAAIYTGNPEEMAGMLGRSV